MPKLFGKFSSVQLAGRESLTGKVRNLSSNQWCCTVAKYELNQKGKLRAIEKHHAVTGQSPANQNCGMKQMSAKLLVIDDDSAMQKYYTNALSVFDLQIDYAQNRYEERCLK